MKSLPAPKHVLWFLLLFNLAVAVAAGTDGHTLAGPQQIITAAAMGVVAAGRAPPCSGTG